MKIYSGKKSLEMILNAGFNNFSSLIKAALLGRIFSIILLVSGFNVLFSSVGLSHEASRPKIESQVVFLYYTDLEKAIHFYESIMGFQQTYSLSWVRIYETNENSSVGIVDEKKGFHRTSKDKPVMLSWVTNDVDGWFRYLKEKGVKIISPLEENQEAGIRSFIFADPGGYTLEFYQWTNR